MVRSPVEPFSLYAMIAEKVDMADDHSFIIIHINPKARFHNGDPVTSEDIEATRKILIEKGLPRYKAHYSRIEKVTIQSSSTIRFDFKANEDGTYDAELPLICLLMPVLCKKQLDSIDFANSGLTPLMGTGPYRIESVEQGHRVVMKRNVDYWGKDLPFNKGMYNFDELVIDYFKNAQAQFQAFLAKEFDVYFDMNPQQWQKAYDIEAVHNGSIVRVDMEHKRPVAVKTMIFNMRKAKFKSWDVRRALLLAFDVDTLNKMVFDGAMQIPHSLFANTFLAHSGKPEGREKEILEKFKDKIEPRLYQAMMDGAFEPAHTKANGDQRENLMNAVKILDNAGYKVKNGVRMTPDGEPLQFEIMIKDDKLEKVALHYKESLKKIGIDLHVRRMDANQYENRVVESDFDMIIHTWTNTLSPGNEQTYYFGVKTADQKGGSNYIGLKDPVVEALAVEVSVANDIEDLKASVHALDRMVMHLCLQIPFAYDNTFHMAYWADKLAIPPIDPRAGTNVMNWGWSPTVMD
jgi:microcin C transport system substrate-binding protein